EREHERAGQIIEALVDLLGVAAELDLELGEARGDVLVEVVLDPGRGVERGDLRLLDVGGHGHGALAVAAADRADLLGSLESGDLIETDDPTVARGHGQAADPRTIEPLRAAGSNHDLDALLVDRDLGGD